MPTLGTGRAATYAIGRPPATFVGADLCHLSAVDHSGTPVTSIGGAGTFDWIFVTGIIAVLLAGA
jgi:uncharacterized membrane protein